jgi:prepilin-type N-terminal cleavage/methylation domain-containing protein
MKRNQKGFTLMELMVVIVIVAILAAVAVPLYVNYVKDAQRTEAKGAIGAIISAEQVYFQGHNSTYLVDPAADFTKDLNVDLTDTQANWSFVIGAPDVGDANSGFKVTADGSLGTKGANSPANGLKVIYSHNRTNGGTWSDETTTIAGP